MLGRSGLFIFIILTSFSVLADCKKSDVSYDKSMDLNFWSFRAEKIPGITINIPEITQGIESCYHQKSSLKVRATEIKEKDYINFEISPITAEFENIPSSEIYHFLDITYDEDAVASNVYIMSFLCSGEIPVGGDAKSGSLIEIAYRQDDSSEEEGSFISTGLPAENISVSQAKKARAKVFDHFLEVFEKKMDLVDGPHNIYIPDILAGNSQNRVTELERKQYSSFFSRTNSSINACSKKFLEHMQNHLIDNVSAQMPFKDIEVKKKRFSERYKMKWDL